jgi:hypothetical protein
MTRLRAPASSVTKCHERMSRGYGWQRDSRVRVGETERTTHSLDGCFWVKKMSRVYLGYLALTRAMNVVALGLAPPHNHMRPWMVM